MRNVVVPELGESVVEARVARWLKKEGDSVRVGEPVVELETEKIDLEVNADSGGVLASIKRQEGEDVKIGELLAIIDETATASSSGNGSSTAAASTPKPASTPTTTRSASTIPPRTSNSTWRPAPPRCTRRSKHRGLRRPLSPLAVVITQLFRYSPKARST